MQEDLDKIGAWRSSKLGFLLLFLAPCVFFTIWEIFSKEEFPCKGKRKPDGHTEIGAWRSLKALFLLPFLIPYALFTAWQIGVLSQKKSFLGRKKERPMGTRKKWERSFLPQLGRTSSHFILISKMREGDRIVGKKSQVQL